jgi:rubredoxin
MLFGISVGADKKRTQARAESRNVGTSKIARRRAAQGEPEEHAPGRAEFDAYRTDVETRGCGSLEGRSGTFRRDLGDAEHAEIALAERIYRVRLSELG